MSGLPPELAAALGALARVPTLLVALDFDGVLAPIVQDPSSSRPLPGSAVAVDALAALPGTTVAMLSGRALGDLRDVSGFGAPVSLHRRLKISAARSCRSCWAARKALPSRSSRSAATTAVACASSGSMLRNDSISVSRYTPP